MKTTINDLINRRSIRKYKDAQISREELDIVLQAGICAPTGKNLQSPIMIAVQDKETIKQLSRINAQIMGVSSDPFYGAPTVVVVLARAESPHAVQDGSLVLGNLMNAAHAIGLGSCWINRAKETFETEEAKSFLKSLGIDGEYEAVGNCVVGYIEGEYPNVRPRKENYIYYIK